MKNYLTQQIVCMFLSGGASAHRLMYRALRHRLMRGFTRLAKQHNWPNSLVLHACTAYRVAGVARSAWVSVQDQTRGTLRRESGKLCRSQRIDEDYVSSLHRCAFAVYFCHAGIRKIAVTLMCSPRLRTEKRAANTA